MPPAAPTSAPEGSAPRPVEIPTLTDGVVTLRPLTMDDLEAVVEQSRDPETARWTFVPELYTEVEGREFISRSATEWQDDLRCVWAVESEGRFAGTVSHQPRGGGAVEVAFAAHPRARGRGVMTRAVRLAVQDAFGRGAQIILWHARVGNIGSLKVAWRCGFAVGGPTIATRHDQVVEVWSGHLRPGDPMAPRGRWLEAPRLTGEIVRIRPFRDEDAARLPGTHDPLTASFSEALPTRAEFPAWLQRVRTRGAFGGAVSCAIADAQSDALLGGVALNRLDVPLFAGTAILGYWLLEDARGRGVVSQALELVVPWAFRGPDEGGLGLHGLSAGCAVDNVASARVLRRAGFAPVGTARRSIRVAGEPHDELLFDLLATDDRDAQRVVPRDLPVLETSRFRLRAWGPDDVPETGDGPDDDSLRYMPSLAHPSRDTYAAWLARRIRLADSGAGLDWCVADRETDHAVGNVTIFGFETGPAGAPFQAELGYWLHPTARGRRVLGEVLPAMVDHAFRARADGGLGLTRLHAGTVAENTASQRILQRAGFRPWGHDRQAWYNAKGELTDGAFFELLASDPRPH